MSVRKRRIVLAAPASEDLDDILLYTERQWGRRQRDTYQKALLKGFEELAKHPNLGKLRPDYESGVRSFQIQQHVVIFRSTATELRIARILHIRRDIDAELID